MIGKLSSLELQTGLAETIIKADMQSMLFTYVGVSEPVQLGAMQWIATLVTGSLGTGLAVVAVAWFAFGILGGHFSFRRGGMLVIGCFLLMSAPMLADLLMKFVRGSSAESLREDPRRFEIEPPPKPVSPPSYDPYAGASLPN